MRDGARSVVVQLFVVVRADVAPGEDFFEVLEERGIDRHYIFEMAMLGAVLHHQDLAVALDDLRLDLANLLIQKDFMGQLAVDYLVADLRDAARAQGIRLTWPAECRLLLLVALQQRLVRPFRRKGLVLIDLIELVEHGPGRTSPESHCFFNELDRLSHSFGFECNLRYDPRLLRAGVSLQP